MIEAVKQMHRVGDADKIEFTDDERRLFFLNVEKLATECGCWIWTGANISKGYGSFWMRGRQWYAHRLSFAMQHGALLEASNIIRHACDTPSCVRPDHLSIGTHADNMRDMSVRGRAAIGERCGISKLTDEDVKTIRKEYERGQSNQAELGERFGVHQMTVSRIVRRKIWTHVI